MKILIVNDSSFNRNVLKAKLGQEGHDVLEAINGLDGLEAAASNMPGLIISDILMPKMDGFLFLKTLRQDERLKHIPFIFYSVTYTGRKEQEIAASLGADAFIIKPKSPEDFLIELRPIIESLHAGRKGQAVIEPTGHEEDFLRDYSAIVNTKLEQKIEELEQAKEELQKLNQDFNQRLKKRTEELETKIAEIERMNKLFVGRELRIIELKERIKELEGQVARVKGQGKT